MQRLMIGVVVVFMTLDAQSQALGDNAAGEPRVSLELPGLELADAMQILADATGYSILVSPNATGKVTAYVVDMLPEAALKQIVEVNGFHYVKHDDVVWVLSDEEYYEDFNLGRTRRVVPLAHASATDVAAALTPALSLHGQAIPYPESNVVLIAETEVRIDEVLALARELDVEPSTTVFQLQHAAAEELLAMVQLQAPASARIHADRRTNQIVVTAPPDTLQRIGAVLNQFDKPDKVSTRVFPLKYADATQTAELVREVLTGRRQSSQSGASGLPQSSDREHAPRLFTTEPGARPAAATPAQNWRNRQAPPAAPAATAGAGVAPGAPAAAAPTLPETTVGGAEGEEALALGPLASVAADPRTNSVIVTHIQSVLDRIAEIIDAVDRPGNFHTYQFQNVNPAELDLEARLAPMLPATGAFLSVDPITKKVTVRAPEEQAREILALLREWDDAIRQVRIEAEIMSVNVNFLRELGITWEAVFNELDEVSLAGAQVIFPPAIGDGSPQARISIGDLEEDEYNVLIQALRSDGDTEIIASPRILVRDGREAVFSSVRDEPFTVVTVDGETNTTLEDVRFLNVGVSLFVVPIINQEDLVSLDVQLEISSLVEIRDGIPVVDRNTAQSNVSVQDGGTVVLAGLRQRSRSDTLRGVPLLSKIPLFGALFRSKRNEKFEREIILVLKPSISPNHEPDAPSLGAIYDRSRENLKEERLD